MSPVFSVPASTGASLHVAAAAARRSVAPRNSDLAQWRAAPKDMGAGKTARTGIRCVCKNSFFSLTTAGHMLTLELLTQGV